jgi:uncharacterized protein YutE (UPF0331/DUF86 family)
MKAVDPIRIRELLRQISIRRSYLEELRKLPRDEFVGDFRNTESARHALLIATQAAIDICNHIAARQTLRTPSDYADCFAVLGEKGIITADLARRLQDMAKFRNRLAHLYWEIDEDQIYSILQNNLGDLDEFREQVVRWMETGAPR